MKNSNVTALIVALSCTAFWNRTCAQNEPSPAPPSPASSWQKPPNEEAAAEAWAAFRAGKNEIAITNANQCILRFGDAANRIQAVLEEEKATLPNGIVSEADKKRIAKYQVLHDVATCFLIRGWAQEKLGHKEEARKAYTAARRYTHARSSRPTGESFWSPAEKASERLLKPLEHRRDDSTTHYEYDFKEDISHYWPRSFCDGCAGAVLQH